VRAAIVNATSVPLFASFAIQLLAWETMVSHLPDRVEARIM
jgi:hypothetical protein